MHNTGARALTGINRREHIYPILYDLHWLPTKRCMSVNILTLMLKWVSVRPGATLSALQNVAPNGEHTVLVQSTQLMTEGERAF